MTKLTAADLFPTTQEIHWHAAQHADRSMKKHGRKRWNEADEAVYFAVYYDIFEKVAGPDHPAVVQYKLDCAA